MSDVYLRLAALRPTTTSEEELYVCPAATAIVAQLSMCNQTAIPILVSVAHTDASGAAAVDDWIYYFYLLESRMTIKEMIQMGPGETIRVLTNVADSVSFILTGLKIV